jgi:hypothetical protein
MYVLPFEYLGVVVSDADRVEARLGGDCHSHDGVREATGGPVDVHVQDQGVGLTMVLSGEAMP